MERSISHTRWYLLTTYHSIVLQGLTVPVVHHVTNATSSGAAGRRTTSNTNL